MSDDLLGALREYSDAAPFPSTGAALCKEAAQEISRLTEHCDAYKEALAKEIRINELLASAMRNPERTGGWEGAERVAQAFDRAADRARAALASPTGEQKDKTP